MRVFFFLLLLVTLGKGIDIPRFSSQRPPLKNDTSDWKKEPLSAWPYDEKELANLTPGEVGNLTETDEKGRNYGMIAAYKGNLDLVKYYYENDTSSRIHHDVYNNFLAHYAALGGHVEIARYVEGKKGWDELNKNDANPYDLATYKGHMEVIRYFTKRYGLTRGSDYTKDGAECIICWAVRGNHLNIVQYFVGKLRLNFNFKCYNKRPLDIAVASLAQRKDFGPNVTLYLVEKGAVGYRDESALHLAASNCATDLVRILVEEKKFDVNIEHRKHSPLYYAVGCKDPSVFEYFASKGVDLNQSDERKTLLHLAAHKGNIDLVKFLIGKKVKIDIHDESGKTPLHYAAGSGNAEIVKFLIDHNATVDSRDHHGVTPLFHAAESGNLESVKILVENNAEPDARTDNNSSPLFNAVINGHFKVVEYLIGKGVEINVKDKNKLSPVIYAIYLNKFPMASYLLYSMFITDFIKI